MRSNLLAAAALLAASYVCPANAADLTVEMHKVTAQGVGEKLGTAKISEKPGGGLEFEVNVTGLPPGEHGFHLHTKGDCGPEKKDGKAQAALAAGPHFDPAATKTHRGPMGAGHKGDLPFLTATDEGIKMAVTAPHLAMSDVEGRALVIHAGGDNYTDHPENGGGKGRIVCGVIPKG
jgi:Cu-Zn family superoxide dismutase